VPPTIPPTVAIGAVVIAGTNIAPVAATSPICLATLLVASVIPLSYIS